MLGILQSDAVDAALAIRSETAENKALASMLGGDEAVKEGVVLRYARGDPVAVVLFGEAGVADAFEVSVDKLVPVEEVPPQYKKGHVVSNPALTTLVGLASVKTWSVLPSGSDVTSAGDSLAAVRSSRGYTAISQVQLWMSQLRALAFTTLMRMLELVRAGCRWWWC